MRNKSYLVLFVASILVALVGIGSIVLGEMIPTQFDAGSIAAGGSTNSIQYNAAGVTGGASQLYWDNVNSRLGIGDSTPDAILEIVSSGGANLFYVSNTAAGNGDIFKVDSSGNIVLGTGKNFTVGTTQWNTGDNINGANVSCTDCFNASEIEDIYVLTVGDTVTGVLNVATMTINSAFTFPTADGTANYVLKTDGSGNVTWGQVDVSSATNLTAGTGLTMSGDTINADEELYTYKKGIKMTGMADTDDLTTIDYAERAITLTGIYCEVDATEVAMDLQIDDGSAADVNGTDIVCDTDGTTDNSLGGDVTLAAGDRLDLILTTVSSATAVSIFWYGTYDD